MNSQVATSGLAASQWLARFDSADASLLRTLESIYGSSAAAGRLPLFRGVVSRFRERFGDLPARIFRAPGRINLRGMHIDSHGGWLNLMTHQREVVAAVTPREDDAVILENVDPHFDNVRFRIRDEIAPRAFGSSWPEFIMDPAVRGTVETARGSWANYVKGSVLSTQHRFPKTRLNGLAGVVGSDLPRGAALSSSAALCISIMRATMGLNGLELDNDSLITAARDAEWYTGSRCGLSDQAAIILGKRDAFVNVALYPARLDTSTATAIPFPESLRILVINSFTERSLSGSAQVDYTRNRFAYSLAMEILRQQMAKEGVPVDISGRMDRLSNITPEILAPMGGMPALILIIKQIPETMSIAELRDRYELPELDEAYARYFGTAPENERPSRISLRGPLLFGIAESERARIFPHAIASGAFEEAGALMAAGHDGDRRLRPGGEPMQCDVDDAAMDRMIASGARIELFPGAYGASTPALDALADAATDAGALGASLTGAGMAGTVLAICRAQDAGKISNKVRELLDSPRYRTLSGRNTGLSRMEADEAVVENVAAASACELTIG